MIRLRLRLPPALPALALPALGLLLACVPFTAASSATVDDVVTALRAQDDARAQTLLEALRAQGLGGAYEVRFLQGVLHLRAGEGEQAARIFDDLEASEGPAPALASGQALSAWAAGRYGEARTRLEHAAQLWPEDPGVWANLGDVYRALAARAYQRVRVLRRNADGEASSPLASDLSVQPRMTPPSDAPAPANSVLAIVPAKTAGSRTPAPAAGSAGTTGSAIPVEPAAPVEPTVPAEPRARAEPVAPADSTTSAEPAAPADPVALAEPAAPADSATSAGSAAPADFTAPAQPAAPAEPIALAEPAAPAAPATSAGSAAPADFTAPAEPAAPAAPATSAGSAAPADFTAPADPAAPAEPVALAEPVAPADPATSAGSAAPTDFAASAEPVAPAELAVPADFAASAEPAVPADFTAPAEPAAPAGSAPSSDPAVPSSPSVAFSTPSPVLTPEASPSASSFPLPSPSAPGNVLSIPVSAPAQAPAGSVECFLAGPWPGVPPAEVLEWLQVRNAQNLSFQSRSALYRVYLGPFDDRKRAVQTMVSLKKDLGIDDVAWVSSGPLRDAVSLGRYSKRESVDRRLRELHAVGLDPKVQLPQAGSWLRGSTSDLRTIRTDWPRTFPNVALTPERCPPSP